MILDCIKNGVIANFKINVAKHDVFIANFIITLAYVGQCAGVNSKNMIKTNIIIHKFIEKYFNKYKNAIRCIIKIAE